MALRAALAALSVLAAAGPTGVVDGRSQAWFDEATAFDLAGAPARAFDIYTKAARLGMPAAQFNVAAMLDSGRGVAPDHREAAIWYARAAARGNARASYNLGLLYEGGDGVPQNQELARTLFATSKLGAARAHLKITASAPAASLMLQAPDLLFPQSEETLDTDQSLELVWSMPRQPDPVKSYVELVALGPGQPLFATFSTGASVALPLTSLEPGRYAWRVTGVTVRSAHYAASRWTIFTVRSAGRQ